MIDPKDIEINWNQVPCIASNNLCQKWTDYIKNCDLGVFLHHADSNLFIIDKFINDNKDLIKNLDTLSLIKFILYASITISVKVDDKRGSML